MSHLPGILELAVEKPLSLLKNTAVMRMDSRGFYLKKIRYLLRIDIIVISVLP
jgi:hypothetical protein